jgi:transcriptional regulator with XRE-family HTH domain
MTRPPNQIEKRLYSKLWDVIRKRRIELGMTQAFVADCLATHRVSYNQMEKGKAIDLHLIIHISNILDLEILDLITLMKRGNEMKFRKKPIVIEAIQFKSGYTTMLEITTFVRCKIKYMVVSTNGTVDTPFSIDTLEGILDVTDGDWIVKGVKGEFYPVKPDIFEMTYDRVES